MNEQINPLQFFISKRLKISVMYTIIPQTTKDAAETRLFSNSPF